jgi:purine nucleosidase
VGRISVLLDTDIGSDIDDAVCLAYLLAHPDCDLLGITTVSGEPVQRARMASAMCRVAGVDVPIRAGAEAPLLVAQRQPRAPQAATLGRWDHRRDIEPGGAVELMRDTIRAHPGEVTLLAIGPLTNVAKLFALDPEIPELLRSLVIMGGRYATSDPGWAVEWNVLLDPHAAAEVFRAVRTRPGLLRAVGLDVTQQVTLPAEEVRARFTAPVLAPALDFAEVWFSSGEPVITFHDPLAAATIFEPDLCGFEPGLVEVETDHAELAGLTRWQPEADGPHEVAVSVDADRYLSHFFDVLDRRGQAGDR